MAWRPIQYVVNGELDNTIPNKVTGWIKFMGMKEKVTFDLDGNFHRDIRGAKIKLTGDADSDGAEYMEGFSQHQTGKVGDMTAGLPPADYVSYPYIEWYGNENGRIVLEFNKEQIEVVGMPIPSIKSDPISREKQTENMENFMQGVAKALKKE